ncbi:MAG: hypothetical protein ACXAEF_01805 [Candidatus Thorarchaeota archaeon]
MNKHLRDALLPFLILGIVSLVVYLTVRSTADVVMISAASSGLLVLNAFIVATLGIWFVVKEGLNRTDRLLMLNTHLAVGLLIFAVSEVTSILVVQLAEPLAYSFAISIIQLVAVLLWTEGVVVYLYSTNEVLEFAKNRYLIPIVFAVIAIVFIIAGVLTIGIQSFSLGQVLSVPIAVGLAFILVSMLILLKYYRGGYLAIPTLLTFLGSLLLIVRTLAWGYLGTSFSDPTAQMIATGAYILLGASLSFRSEKLAKID